MVEAYLNLLLKLLRYLGALHLLRCRNKAALRRPFICSQNNSLQDLHRFEPILFPDSITLFEHEILHRLVRTQIRQLCSRIYIDGLGFKSMTQVDLVGNNDTNRLFGFSICV